MQAKVNDAQQFNAFSRFFALFYLLLLNLLYNTERMHNKHLCARLFQMINNK